MPRRNSGPRLRFLKKRRVWYVAWTEEGRSRERSTGTANRGDAEIVLADFLRTRQRAESPRDPAEILVTDMLSDYMQDRRSDVAAPDRIRHAIKALVPFWKGRTLAQVARQSCRAYVKARGRSAGTTRRELGVLRAAINHAHREGRITRALPVHLPEKPESRERWLTRAEAAKLLWAALREPRVRLYLPLFIVMGLSTGQRKTALLGLRWSQVDLSGGRIDFNAPGLRRTSKRRSRIPIPAKLLGHLRRARKHGSDLGFVINDEGARIKDLKKGFASACRRAELIGVTPHTLRHTCATWLMQRGVGIWEAAGFLGMTPETLNRVYSHHSPDYLASAAKVL